MRLGSHELLQCSLQNTYIDKLQQAMLKIAGTEEGRLALRKRFNRTVDIETLVAELTQLQPQYRAILISKRGDVMGWGEYTIQISETNESIAEVSILITPDFQGIGFGSLLARHLIEYCRENERGTSMIRAVVEYDNMGSRQLFSKIARVLAGRLVENRDNMHFIFPVDGLDPKSEVVSSTPVSVKYAQQVTS